MYLLNFVSVLFFSFLINSQDRLDVIQEFQGKAYYFSKTNMKLGAWGARMSELKKNKLRTG